MSAPLTRRVTVKIMMTGDTAERDFYLFENDAPRFIVRIKRKGGTVRIVPFAMGADLMAMLTKAGVDASAIR